MGLNMNFIGGKAMYLVDEIWNDGTTVTHSFFNDPYAIGKHYTKAEIEEYYKQFPNIARINIKEVR